GVTVYGTDYDTPDGTGVRDYIHVADLAEAHVIALRNLIEQPDRSLTLNCGYNRGFSVLEVLDAVERVSGVAIQRTMEGRRAGDPAALVADNSRIVETFGWQPRWANLDTIVTHALAWEKRLSELRRSAAA
ncbi:MAG: UDP-glucose 4-epimerase, partial [Alphaproteobacteria bacterium]|nr:UDP-glucose 4-epimerase [Alphaproteobacteria bacterium]